MELAATSSVPESKKGKIHWERLVIQRRKALFLFQRLLELEKSDASFKDTVISFIELLQKGIGRLYLSEHSHTLDIDLGVTNAQCTPFECFNQPLYPIGSTTEEANNYSPQSFCTYDEDTIIDTSFL